jgi:hypothetical protein
MSKKVTLKLELWFHDEVDELGIEELMANVRYALLKESLSWQLAPEDTFTEKVTVTELRDDTN